MKRATYRLLKQVRRFRNFGPLSLLIVLIALPLTIVLLQYQQNLRQQAQEKALLYLLPNILSVDAKQELSLSVSVDSGPYTISAVQLNLTYPKEKLVFLSADFSKSAFPVETEFIEGAGLIRIGRDALSALPGEQHIGTLHFVASERTSPQEIVLSQGSYILRSNDQVNVLGGLKVIDSTASANTVKEITTPFFWRFILSTNESLWKWILTTLGLIQ